MPVPSDEDVLPRPEAPYGTAKYCAEQYVALSNRLHGTDHGVLRLGNVYGPRQDPAGEAGVIAIFSGLALPDWSRATVDSPSIRAEPGGVHRVEPH